MSDCSSWPELQCAWVGIPATIFIFAIFIVFAWITMRGE